MYAKPPPPQSPSPSDPSSPSSSVNNASASGTATSRTSSKGKGRANAQPVVADETAEPQTADIDLTSEGVEATSLPTRVSKRRREVHTTDSVIDLSEEAVVESGSTRGAKRRNVETLGDVIVIED